MISEDKLNEAAYEYSGKVSHPMTSAFKDGAEWCMKQILECAVDAEVTVPASAAFKQIRYKLPADTNLKVGDKVKIIVL